MQVSIYNLHTEKQMRTFALESTHTKATKAVCVSFRCACIMHLKHSDTSMWSYVAYCTSCLPLPLACRLHTSKSTL